MPDACFDSIPPRTRSQTSSAMSSRHLEGEELALVQRHLGESCAARRRYVVARPPRGLCRRRGERTRPLPFAICAVSSTSQEKAAIRSHDRADPESRAAVATMGNAAELAVIIVLGNLLYRVPRPGRVSNAEREERTAPPRASSSSSPGKHGSRRARILRARERESWTVRPGECLRLEVPPGDGPGGAGN